MRSKTCLVQYTLPYQDESIAGTQKIAAKQAAFGFRRNLEQNNENSKLNYKELS